MDILINWANGHSMPSNSDDNAGRSHAMYSRQIDHIPCWVLPDVRGEGFWTGLMIVKLSLVDDLTRLAFYQSGFMSI